MAKTTKLDSYLNAIYDAIHSDTFNQQDFLDLVVNVLVDFRNENKADADIAPILTSHTQHSQPIAETVAHGTDTTATHTQSELQADTPAGAWDEWQTELTPSQPAHTASDATRSTTTHSTTTTSHDASALSFHVDHDQGTLVTAAGDPVEGLTARITTPDDISTQTALNPDFYAQASELGADMIRLDVTGAVDGRTIDQQMPLIDEAISLAKQAGLGVQLEFSQQSVSMDAEETAAFWTVAAPKYANDSAVTYEMTNEPGWPGYDDNLLDSIASVYHIMREAAPNKPIGVLDFPVINDASEALDDIHGLEARGVDFSDATTVAWHGYSPNGVGPALEVRDAGYSMQMTEITDYGSEPVLYQLHEAGMATFDLAGGFGITNPDPEGDPRGAFLDTFTTYTAPALEASGVDWTADNLSSTPPPIRNATTTTTPNPRTNTESLNGGSIADLPKLDASNSFKETFDNGLGSFGHVWGDVKAQDGYIELTSPADTHENASAMIQPSGADAGFGYGLYSFTLSTSSNTVGPYALLWPATDTWPGAEIDAFELSSSNGKPYSTVHWDGGGQDEYNYHYMPDSIDATDIHTYSVNWAPDALTFYVDGRPYNTVTDNVPLDFSDGGQNAAPGVGQLTAHWPDQNTQDNSIRLYEFNYIPNADTFG